MTYEEYLKSIYYDAKHPGSFGGLKKLYRAVRKEGKYVLSRAKIKKWLQKQETFTLHRQIYRKFKRTQVVVPEIGFQWDADTAVMTSFLKDNDSYGYLLFVIDVFSKTAWAVPLKSTKGVEMVHALSSVFSSTTPPQKLRTDKGSEFYNKPVHDFLKEKHVTHFFSRNEQKANAAERGIKTIKARLSRYMTHIQTHQRGEVLPKMIKSYNATYHRTNNRAPNKVKTSNGPYIWLDAYDSVSKT